MKKKNPEITLNFLHQLAEDLYFELNEQECKKLLLEFDAIEEQMSVVKEIDTKDVWPLDFPFDIKKEYLRSDTVGSVLNTMDVLKTAGQVKDEYVVINKVISNEEN